MNLASFVFPISFIVLAFYRETNAIESRIVGGMPAGENEFPHQVSLRWHGLHRKSIFSLLESLTKKKQPEHFCGGSVITKYWILTAAHCNLKLSNNGFMEAMAGETNFDNENEPGSTKQVRKVIQFLVHENYPGQNKISPYDIAVVKIDLPFHLNDYVKAIRLPKKNSIPKGEAIVTGWGSMSKTFKTEFPRTLQKAILPIVNIKKCKALYGTEAPVDYTNICAEDAAGKKATCAGDSGGPLIQTRSTKVTQIGIVSYGETPCGQKDKPSVFTRVSHYIDWINDKIMSAE